MQILKEWDRINLPNLREDFAAYFSDERMREVLKNENTFLRLYKNQGGNIDGGVNRTTRILNPDGTYTTSNDQVNIVSTHMNSTTATTTGHVENSSHISDMIPVHTTTVTTILDDTQNKIESIPTTATIQHSSTSSSSNMGRTRTHGEKRGRRDFSNAIHMSTRDVNQILKRDNNSINTAISHWIDSSSSFIQRLGDDEKMCVVPSVVSNEQHITADISVDQAIDVLRRHILTHNIPPTEQAWCMMWQHDPQSGSIDCKTWPGHLTDAQSQYSALSAVEDVVTRIMSATHYHRISQRKSIKRYKSNGSTGQVMDTTGM
jgi:hypothetical protein